VSFELWASASSCFSSVAASWLGESAGALFRKACACSRAAAGWASADWPPKEERVRAGGRPADRVRLGECLVGLLALLGPEPELEQRVEHAAEVDGHGGHVAEPELAQAQMGQLVLLGALDEGEFLLETHGHLLAVLDDTFEPRETLGARGGAGWAGGARRAPRRRCGERAFDHAHPAPPTRSRR
jgi:hypothetical protein